MRKSSSFDQMVYADFNLANEQVGKDFINEAKTNDPNVPRTIDQNFDLCTDQLSLAPDRDGLQIQQEVDNINVISSFLLKYNMLESGSDSGDLQSKTGYRKSKLRQTLKTSLSKPTNYNSGTPSMDVVDDGFTVNATHSKNRPIGDENNSLKVEDDGFVLDPQDFQPFQSKHEISASNDINEVLDKESQVSDKAMSSERATGKFDTGSSNHILGSAELDILFEFEEILKDSLEKSKSANDMPSEFALYQEYLEALENYSQAQDDKSGPKVFISSLAEEKRYDSLLNTHKNRSTWASQVYDAVLSALQITSEEVIKNDDNVAVRQTNLDIPHETSFNSKNDEQINPMSPVHSTLESYLNSIARGGDEVEYTMIKGKRSLKMATLLGLLHHIFEPKFTDLGLLYGFLLNHPLFLPTSDLLDITLEILKQKLNNTDAPDSGVFSLVNILDFWIDYFPMDFKGDIQKITDFIYSHQISTSKNQLILKKLTKRLEKLQTGPKNLVNLSIGGAIPQHTKSQFLRIVDFDAKELAQQISLLDFEFFKQTSPRDFLNSEIPKIIQWSDRLTWWIISEILNIKDDTLRASTIKHLLETGKELENLKNYSGLKSIIDALYYKPIHRLTKTFDKLSKGSKSKLYQLRDFLYKDEKSILDKRIASSPPPLIPDIFGKLDQIGIKYARNSDQYDPINLLSYKDGELWINIDKMVQVSFIIQDIHKWQATGYNFKPDTKIQDHIMNYPRMMNHTSADIASCYIQK